LYAKLDRSGPKFGALAWIGAATLATVTGYGVLAGFAFLKANDLSDAAAQRGAENVAIEHRLAELRDDPYAVQNLAIQLPSSHARGAESAAESAKSAVQASARLAARVALGGAGSSQTEMVISWAIASA
ncbi:MAG: hypothetical protein CMD83_04555, partial [Gammaproteobacteria bacterium]|nr:hypothetical protein [Gammaproteobacteria bacterium]